MRLLAPALLKLFLITLATPAAAQDAQRLGDIVVTGTSEADQARQARQFVATIAPLRGRSQLNRFETPVCPVAVGLREEEKRAVVQRLRQVAGAIGLPVAKASCRPNLLVAVVAGKRQFMEGLIRERPALFAMMTPREAWLLARNPDPVVAWQQTGWISVNGNEIMLDLYYDVPLNITYGNSPRFIEPGHLHFKAAAVVIEAEATVGLTTTQLADYAAMRGFARTEPSKLAPSAPSILRAVGAPVGSAVPVTLTQWDLGFLRGLYASGNDVNALVRSTEINRSVEREVSRMAAK